MNTRSRIIQNFTNNLEIENWRNKSQAKKTHFPKFTMHVNHFNDMVHVFRDALHIF